MTNPVHLHSEATVELEETAAWYEQQHAGLGARFLAAVDTAIEGIQLWPQAAPAWTSPALPDAIRRARVRGFPYRIVYVAGEDAILVLAFAHDRRRPGYWRERGRT